MIAKKFMSRLKKLNKRMKSSEEDNEMPTKELFVLKIGETLTLVKNVLE